MEMQMNGSYSVFLLSEWSSFWSLRPTMEQSSQSRKRDGRELVKGSCTSDQWEPSGPDARLRACARGRREAETVRLGWACACSGLCRS